MEKAYCRLHELGHAHSAEVWQKGELVGGLYGIRIGKVFFGESMFSKVSNASRFAFHKICTAIKTGRGPIDRLPGVYGIPGKFRGKDDPKERIYSTAE